MKTKLSQEEKEFLMIEFQEISNNMRAFWKVRLTIIGFVVSLIGVLLAQLKSTESFKMLILEASLVLIITGTTTIIISITKHIVVYAIRLREIESSFIKNGFWKKWKKYVDQNPTYTNTYSIAVAMHLLNLVIMIYIVWNNFHFFKQLNYTEILFTSIFIVGSLVNLWYIKNFLRPKRGWAKLKKEWDDY
ncbi:hypothetical protein M0G43_12775 [Subsaxibacter sp. CAU 1640]|uniref:hypothetical protein n=1 Tax=Subsaxibacter sp. CAU 1640 TaxID=2933271 RepID=UPI0020059D3D|nr:hypothetical protein [Subsaxibacter sp. CAU 1640]MCK7591453.1 hypothetical protein [Subsaxibacter sp. CAU 1640]